jgi:hypothetical protein
MNKIETLQEIKSETRELLEKEKVPSFLWNLTKGATDIQVIHRQRDPILVVNGEVVAFWCE